MTLTQRVADRYLAAARPKMEVHSSPTEIAINLGVVGEGEVGYLLLRPVEESHRSDCDKQVATLQAKVFGGETVPVWRVVDVLLEPAYQHKGWGMKMYEAAIKKVRPGIVVTGNCTHMGTSREAMRVWKALARKYPVKGSGKNLALAVK